MFDLFIIVFGVAAFVAICFYFSQKQSDMTVLQVKDFLVECVNPEKDNQLYNELSKSDKKYAYMTGKAVDIAQNGGKTLMLISKNYHWTPYLLLGINLLKCGNDVSIQRMIFGVEKTSDNLYVLRYPYLANDFLKSWDLHPEVKTAMRKYPELKQIWIAYEQYRDIKTGELWCKKSSKS